MYYLQRIFLLLAVTEYSSYVHGSDQSDQKGDASTCKCMPYYKCDLDLNDVYSRGTVDLRTNSFTRSANNLDLFRCEDRLDLCCQESTTVITKPELKSCGYRNSKGLDFNLVRSTGTEALFGEFPWVVGILVNGVYYGAGSLIHPNVVITAAHILTRRPSASLKIRAGEWDTMTRKERLGYQERLVKEIYMHRDFLPQRPTAGNDIALLLLEEPVQLDEHINVICMPNQDEDFSEYKECVANGWGKTSYGPQSKYAAVLKRVEIDMVGRVPCQSQLRRYRKRHIKLDSSFICAGGEEGKDTCQGDGGAPLACPVGNDQYKLSGLVVAGIRCGLKDVPAVYTDVGKFRQWVDDKMAAWGFNNTIYTAKGIDSRLTLTPRRL